MLHRANLSSYHFLNNAKHDSEEKSIATLQGIEQCWPYKRHKQMDHVGYDATSINSSDGFSSSAYGHARRNQAHTKVVACTRARGVAAHGSGGQGATLAPCRHRLCCLGAKSLSRSELFVESMLSQRTLRLFVLALLLLMQVASRALGFCSATNTLWTNAIFAARTCRRDSLTLPSRSVFAHH